MLFLAAQPVWMFSKADSKFALREREPTKSQTMFSRSSIKPACAPETVTVFVQHTSCSLMVMENADPTARRDLEEFFDRLVPEDVDYFTHGSEGSDDMPSHIRTVLTRTSETIPIVDGQMHLGTWQGIFLFEHRRAPHRRSVFVTTIGE
jgi:secondary thiamine-phosphate synthase enzyme